ncbi:GntR family transcriptional regulator [Methylobacterium sp. J-030]|uniref:GntR family transcriptional regulator n=1 Tax=Methylobacterium sp. J-030 TaxID=2836627 RepID=UPI001FB8C5AB|nr:GntR family transcriptional regulator [Methylobacterium sp. J-030]MCJ2072438.1 GntR family transcriptional regulator [Methylobacterium sp. J-030]
MPTAPVSVESRRRAPAQTNDVPLADSVYAKIKAAIIHNDLEPGSQITEQQIAAELEVSRTPVHQAIIRLENEGWLKLQPKRGIAISTVTAGEMRYVYEVLMGLEGIAVERLAARPTSTHDPVDAELLAAAVEADEALAGGDLARWAQSDDRFHSLLVGRSGNPYLASLARTVMEQAHRARLLTLRLRPSPTSSNRDHRAILEAVAVRDPAAAKGALETHRRRGMDVLLPILERLASKRRFAR